MQWSHASQDSPRFDVTGIGDRPSAGATCFSRRNADVGLLNQAIHLWPYASQAEREEKRGAMKKAALRNMSAEASYTDHMENCTLRPVPFSPL